MKNCNTCKHRFVETRGTAKFDVCFGPAAERMGSPCSTQTQANGPCGSERLAYQEAAPSAASRGVVPA